MLLLVDHGDGIVSKNKNERDIREQTGDRVSTFHQAQHGTNHAPDLTQTIRWRRYLHVPFFVYLRKLHTFLLDGIELPLFSPITQTSTSRYYLLLSVQRHQKCIPIGTHEYGNNDIIIQELLQVKTLLGPVTFHFLKLMSLNL